MCLQVFFKGRQLRPHLSASSTSSSINTSHRYYFYESTFSHHLITFFSTWDKVINIVFFCLHIYIILIWNQLNKMSILLHILSCYQIEKLVCQQDGSLFMTMFDFTGNQLISAGGNPLMYTWTLWWGIISTITREL